MKRLRRDVHSDALWAAALADKDKGRMSRLVRAASLPFDAVLLTPRFAAVQPGKIRPIDDATASGLNGKTECCEKMSHDSVDMLAAVTAAMLERDGELPHFWKVRP